MTIDELMIYGCSMGAAGSAAVVSYPALARWWDRVAGGVERYHEAKVGQAAKVLDDIFMDVKPGWLQFAYGLGPLAVGLFLYIATNNLLLVGLGAVVGAILPDLWVKQQQARRKRHFRAQMVDALFLLSSSLRAGLSLTQALETLEAEMTPPASQEFGLMIKAHRLGRSLEEAFQGLQSRMACEELTLMTTAILVSRGTGGDVMKILHQLITTIRERKKLSEKVLTLTLQGRLQAYIMSALPVLFAMFVRTFNPDYFDVLLSAPLGRSLIAVAVALWVVGMVLLFRMSRVTDV